MYSRTVRPVRWKFFNNPIVELKIKLLKVVTTRAIFSTCRRTAYDQVTLRQGKNKEKVSLNDILRWDAWDVLGILGTRKLNLLNRKSMECNKKQFSTDYQTFSIISKLNLGCQRLRHVDRIDIQSRLNAHKV